MIVRHILTRVLGARVLSAVVLGAATLAAGSGHATGVEVTLDYQIGSALLTCPDAAEFRREVSRQLGHNPFREAGAAHHVTVRIDAAGSGIGGRVEWRDSDDQWEGERTFSSRNESCAATARAMALATAIQIELLSEQEESGPAGASAAPAAPAAPVAVPLPTPTPAPVPAPPPPPPVSPPSQAVAAAAQAASMDGARRGLGMAIEVGAGIVEDGGNAPLFTVPRLALGWGRPSALVVRLAVSGLGPGAEVSAADGIARLDRLLVVLDVVHYFRAEERIQPLLAVGVGWQRLHAEGTSASPTVSPAREGSVVSGLATLGGGLAIGLGRELFLLVELEGLLFRPTAAIQIGSATAASLDGTAFFARGGLLARF